MKIEDCPSYDGCIAPLCPLDGSLPDAIWFSNEPICKARGYQRLHWIKAQKKIARIGADGYFTHRMLENTRRVGKGIGGIDPDSRKAKL